MMGLPYANASSGEKALNDLQKILRGFGCAQFGTWNDEEAATVTVQFKYRGNQVSVTGSSKGYAAAWLKENPWTHRRKVSRADYEKKALNIGRIAIYSMLRDWIKGQVTAVECGILSFEGAFLGQMLLPSGKTVLEAVTTGANPLLPAPCTEPQK